MSILFLSYCLSLAIDSRAVVGQVGVAEEPSRKTPARSWLHTVSITVASGGESTVLLAVIPSRHPEQPWLWYHLMRIHEQKNEPRTIPSEVKVCAGEGGRDQGESWVSGGVGWKLGKVVLWRWREKWTRGACVSWGRWGEVVWSRVKVVEWSKNGENGA
nr:hypothetical protein [Tanacetum cinerariifolium]